MQGIINVIDKNTIARAVRVLSVFSVTEDHSVFIFHKYFTYTWPCFPLTAQMVAC